MPRQSATRDVPKIAIEAGTTALWWKYVRGNGTVIGIDRFGESAPGGKLFEFFGFTAEKVADAARRCRGPVPTICRST